nr:MAG TPA: Minor capsid protein [Caudoviricetes sp.]
MDFIERLNDSVNSIHSLPIKCILGYLKSEECLVLYPLPGGQVEREYFDGTKDQLLNYEFVMKSKDQEKIHKTLWQIQYHLEGLSLLLSNDGSFDFEEIKITNKPYINDEDEQGYYIFILDIQVSITTFNMKG